jgi:hypothetical protein
MSRVSTERFSCSWFCPVSFALDELDDLDELDEPLRP